MKKPVKKILSLILCFVMLNCFNITSFSKEAGAARLADKLTMNNKICTLSSKSRIFLALKSEPTEEISQTARLIAGKLSTTGLVFSSVPEIIWGDEKYAEKGDIILKTDDNIKTEDAYKISAGDRFIITAADCDGLLYGADMLIKCIRSAGGGSFTGFDGEFYPDAKERTVHLDCGRKYFTPEWIKNFIRQISFMGYNSLQLHFSEDGGFRADFWDENYYRGKFRPENDFSWLAGSHVQSWVKEPYRNDPDRGAYLKTSELVDIINTAKENHIDIIPSFDSPAHMDYITWKYEQNYKNNYYYSFKYKGVTYRARDEGGTINYTGATGYSSPVWPYYTTVNIVSPTAKAFTFALYSDIADFFSEYAGSTKFNIGADEVNLSKSLWSYRDFPVYVNELNKMLKQKGYTVRMFNDFAGSTKYNYTRGQDEYGFDKDIEIVFWNSDFSPQYGGMRGNVCDVSDFINEGRTVYNCIQTNTYYVLRVNSYSGRDARDPLCRDWTFYHSTEDKIYNEWTPGNIRESGEIKEPDRIVPPENLGGAYFCIWNDYAALNSEYEIWNGAPDSRNCNYYYLFDRMWSNAVKMWNSNINTSVSFEEFENIRSSFGFFPGFTSCSEPALIPDAGEIKKVQTVTKSELIDMLSVKEENENYSLSSYTAYLKAYEDCERVNRDENATQQEVDRAVKNLTLAIELLSQKENAEIKVSIINSQTGELIENIVFPADNKNFRYCVYMKPLPGIKVLYGEGCDFIPSFAAENSGFIAGRIYFDEEKQVKLYAEEKPCYERLNELIAEQEKFSLIKGADLKSYNDAVNAGKAAVNSKASSQAEINSLIKNIEAARNAVTVKSDSREIYDIIPISNPAVKGRDAAVKIITSADTDSIEIPGVTLSAVSSSISGGRKTWFVRFPAEKTGTFTYTVRGGNEFKDFTLSIK